MSLLSNILNNPLKYYQEENYNKSSQLKFSFKKNKSKLIKDDDELIKQNNINLFPK